MIYLTLLMPLNVVPMLIYKKSSNYTKLDSICRACYEYKSQVYLLILYYFLSLFL